MATAKTDSQGRGTWGAYLLFFVSLVLLTTVGVAAQLLSIPIGLAVTELFVILLPAALFVRLTGLPWRTAFRFRPISMQKKT